MPDPARASRRVVVNTTPIIALALIGQLDLLQHLYGEVVIPPAVQREVLAGVPPQSGVAELKDARWLRAIALQDPQRADLLADLDRGEAEVIALAQELGADLVIIDERLARRHAERIGLTLTGTLGVLLRAKERGFVRAIGPLMEDLRRGGIRLSDRLVQEALELAGE
jgi:predicted nucleic acid-binding protein